MTSHDLPPVPEDAPRVGEMYAHFKTGNRYEVVGIALDATDEWVVVYRPLYDGAVAELFTRPCKEWHALVAWQGHTVRRFEIA